MSLARRTSKILVKGSPFQKTQLFCETTGGYPGYFDPVESILGVDKTWVSKSPERVGLGLSWELVHEFLNTPTCHKNPMNLYHVYAVP